MTLDNNLSEHFAQIKAQRAAQPAPEVDQPPAIQFDSDGVQSIPTREKEVQDMPRGVPNNKPGNGNSTVAEPPTETTEVPTTEAAPAAAPTTRAHRANQPADTFSLAQVTELRAGYEERLAQLDEDNAKMRGQLTTAKVMIGEWALIKRQLEEAGIDVG